MQCHHLLKVILVIWPFQKTPKLIQLSIYSLLSEKKETSENSTKSHFLWFLDSLCMEFQLHFLSLIDLCVYCVHGLVLEIISWLSFLWIENIRFLPHCVWQPFTGFFFFRSGLAFGLGLSWLKANVCFSPFCERFVSVPRFHRSEFDPHQVVSSLNHHFLERQNISNVSCRTSNDPYNDQSTKAHIWGVRHLSMITETNKKLPIESKCQHYRPRAREREMHGKAESQKVRILEGERVWGRHKEIERG